MMNTGGLSTPRGFELFMENTHVMQIVLKGSADHAVLCANTDANHTSTTFSEFFFLQIFFILMLTKEYVFVFVNFQLLH